MAQKRMISSKVIDTDAFLEMPLSAQALYFHLNLRADDDGFIGSPKRILQYIGASEDDLKLLLLKRFVLYFDSGVIVVKHWKMHNTIQKDRYTPTVYQEELKMLGITESKTYTLSDYEEDTKMFPKCFHSGNTDKISIDKNSIDKDIYIVEQSIDSIKEIVAYMNEVWHKNYKYQTPKTQNLIRTRLKEGFTVEDFKKVIDHRYSEWGRDEKMAAYLRPETVFGTKFESYLNNAPQPRVIVTEDTEDDEPPMNLWSDDWNV